VECKWTDSPTMDCPDVCLEAFWLQELEWVLEDCHKRSCWKNPIGVSVPRPYWSDVYVCSKSCRLYLTVVYWLLECNKVPSWIENPSTLQYKILTDLLAWYIEPYVEEIIHDYQCGFRKGRSTNDQIFCLRMVLEKACEYNVDVPTSAVHRL
jgi:hypothetical protein